MKMHPKRRGFTLIELLIVIAIIAIIAAMLFPVFARAREKARQTTCASNFRQLGMALHMYVGDYDEVLPYVVPTFWDNSCYSGKAWDLVHRASTNKAYIVDLLQPYLKNTQVLFCPSVPLQGKIWVDENITTADNLTAYQFNGTGMCNGDPWRPPPSLASVVDPSQAAVGMELILNTHRPSQPSFHAHSEGVNVLYLDPHVKWTRSGSPYENGMAYMQSGVQSCIVGWWR